EKGALLGPSMMPGGSEAAWHLVKPLFQSIAAHTTDDAACCEWIGSGGAGHFVKMVHNGIEYGDMQLIAEVYQIMKLGLGMDNPAMAETFAAWNEGKLESYLIGITRDILRYKDENGQYVLDYILDKAGQKGTGKWTGQEALEEGVPLTLVVEAVLARSLSAMKNTRLLASQTYGDTDHKIAQGSLSIQDLEDALYASKIIAYAQGFMLMSQAAQIHSWKLNFGEIANIWREGCIIRSVFLSRIKEAYESDPSLENLLLAPSFVQDIQNALPGWRRVAATAQMHGISIPCISSALAFFDGFTSETLPANMLQAQRDYFGAHTYERTDRPEGEYFHTNWTGEGGSTASTVYQK
ncbi:MAG TPA: decarboxylating NADP(+)-dependent phosphogluconate dehydrogenase, partial [Anaerolineaceae bacterium]|nr:decarboxylating NADP(+)-dependent phosphogluconate dehydrogenase [Anaerolineaceae bacterium]